MVCKVVLAIHLQGTIPLPINRMYEVRFHALTTQPLLLFLLDNPTASCGKEDFFRAVLAS